MERQELRRWLLDNAFQKCGNKINAHAIKRDKDILDALYDYTDFLKDVPLKTRVHCLLLGQEELHKCPECEKSVVPDCRGDQRVYCSRKCALSSDTTLKKKEKTCLYRFGYKTPLSDPNTHEKSKKTVLRKYGVDNIRKAEGITEKIVETNKRRYNCEHTFQVYEFREKAKLTSLQRYGTEFPAQSEQIRLKREHTCIQKYGCKNPYESDKIRAKIRNTMLDRYGVSYAMQNTEVQNKAIETTLRRYGVANAASDPDIRKMSVLKANPHITVNTYELLRNKELFMQAIADGSLNNLPIHRTTLCKYKRLYGLEEIKSFPEEYILSFLKKYTDCIHNSRSIIPSYELDIYLPEYNLATEYDGIYWHAESKGKDKNYHLNKTLLCAKKNIQLLHIFSSDNLELWKCFLENLLGLSQIIYARQTQIREISNANALEFCDQNHLQGGINSKYNYGLFYESVLVAVMTFTKARFSKADYELLRFCTKKGYRVVGGAGKLLKHFRKDHKGDMVSYANMRWSNGKLYDALGFKLLHRSSPNYFYTKDYQTLYSRNKFQKHKLLKLLDYFDHSLTEVQNMKLNGWDRIWDCGNLVYLLEQ